MDKKKGLTQTTIHISALGSIDRLNETGKKAILHDAIATVPTFGLFMTISNIDGLFNTNISYPAAEFARKDIQKIIASFEKELGMLTKLKH